MIETIIHLFNSAISQRFVHQRRRYIKFSRTNKTINKNDEDVLHSERKNSIIESTKGM